MGRDYLLSLRSSGSAKVASPGGTRALRVAVGPRFSSLPESADEMVLYEVLSE